MPVAEFQFPPKTYVDRKRNVAQIVWCLYLDGPFADESGGAAAMVLDALRERRVILSKQVLLAILSKLDHPGAAYGHLVRRQSGGKRTYYIGLVADPHKDPFPKNPWPNDPKATYQGIGENTPTADEKVEAYDDLEETFTRQALTAPAKSNGTSSPDILDRLRAANDRVMPKPEPEPELELDDADREEMAAVIARRAATPEPEPETSAAPAETKPAVPAGDENALVAVDRLATVTLPDDLADLLILDTPTPSPSGFAAKLTEAITLITGAIADQATRDADTGRNDIGRLVDERMSAYVRLMDENQALKAKLAGSLQREKDLIALARQLKRSLEHFQRSQG